MLIQDRHRLIAKAIASQASVSTIELARKLHVSSETVRRDLIYLESIGAIRRVYGGAVAPQRQRSSEPPFAKRAEINAEAKQAVGGISATLVEPDSVIFVDVGSTGQEVARALAQSFRGTVVSHSLLVAFELARTDGPDVLLAPGRLRRGEWSVSGTATHRFIQDMHYDVAFLSCGGVDASAGATDFDADDAEIKRTVARNSERVYVVADSSKHGVVGRYAIADWYDVHGLITEERPPSGLEAAIRSSGGQVQLPQSTSE